LRFQGNIGPGDAGRLAAEAVREGFEIVVAAGGDGTVNEVLNGMAGVPAAFEQSRMGVIPLGTVNVFARELKIVSGLAGAWAVLEGGHEARIDLPFVDFISKGKMERRYFAQLAGAGLDARAVELVHWDLKKKVGALAYVVAGLKALSNPQSSIIVTADAQSVTGELVLVGNGILYGGDFRVFRKPIFRTGYWKFVCSQR
jgi:diacylglycerol kinase family enzyme